MSPRGIQGRPITKRQQEVLDAIDRRWEKQGFAPSLRELMEDLRIRSVNGVRDHLRLLAKKGAIAWEPLKSRTVRVVRAA